MNKYIRSYSDCTHSIHVKSTDYCFRDIQFTISVSRACYYIHVAMADNNQHLMMTSKMNVDVILYVRRPRPLFLVTNEECDEWDMEAHCLLGPLLKIIRRIRLSDL